jgi:hypothetical protein
MNTYTTYCKYLCLAALAGFLVAGTPSHSYAIDKALFGGLLDQHNDIITGGIDAVTTGTPVCGDVKGTACSPDGSVQKCQSKRGAKLCQTCTNGKWGSGYVGDCWGSGTTTYEADDTSVLDRF